jgi:hypothetical protein
MLFIIIIRRILVLFIYITRLASDEIFSPSNKIRRELGRAKDLSAALVSSTVNTIYALIYYMRNYGTSWFLRLRND